MGPQPSEKKNAEDALKEVIMSKIVDALFGCPHKRCTFPITAKSRQPRVDGPMTAATYIVCLDCGKEFGYDWQKMNVIAPANHAA